MPRSYNLKIDNVYKIAQSFKRSFRIFPLIKYVCLSAMKTLRSLPGEFLLSDDRRLDAEWLNDTVLCHHTNGCGGGNTLLTFLLTYFNLKPKENKGFDSWKSGPSKTQVVPSSHSQWWSQHCFHTSGITAPKEPNNLAIPGVHHVQQRSLNKW